MPQYSIARGPRAASGGFLATSLAELTLLVEGRLMHHLARDLP